MVDEFEMNSVRQLLFVVCQMPDGIGGIQLQPGEINGILEGRQQFFSISNSAPTHCNQKVLSRFHIDKDDVPVGTESVRALTARGILPGFRADRIRQARIG